MPRLAIGLVASLLLASCADDGDGDLEACVAGGKCDALGGVLIDAIELDFELDERGRSEFVEVEIPEDAISFSFVAIGDQAEMYEVDALIDPLGENVIERNRAHFDSGRATILVPNNRGVTLHPGVWQLQIASSSLDGRMPGRSPMRGAFYVKRGERPTTGTLRLHVHLPSEPGEYSWTYPEVLENPIFNDGITVLEDIFARAGMDVVVDDTFSEFPPEFLVLKSVSGTGNDMDRMFEYAQGRPGVNVFVINRFELSVLPVGQSVSAASPIVGGPGTLPGRNDLGVMARSTWLVGRPFGQTLGHEIGHYLGLFHVAEQAGGTTDPIADTVNDRNNLMFYQDSGGEELTDEQVWVLMGSPLLEHPR